MSRRLALSYTLYIHTHNLYTYNTYCHEATKLRMGSQLDIQGSMLKKVSSYTVIQIATSNNCGFQARLARKKPELEGGKCGTKALDSIFLEKKMSTNCS